jgi:hypothetical protein
MKSVRKMDKSLGDQMRGLKEEYQRFVAGLSHNDPISYEEWLELEVLHQRRHRRLMTTAQVELEFHLARGSAKKAAQRGTLPAQKAGHDWIILREDAQREWGWRLVNGS